MKKFLLILCLIASSFINAQQSNKLSPAFRYIISHPLNVETEATYPTLYKQTFAKAINKKTGLLEEGYICIIYTSNAKVLKEKSINVQSVLPKFVTAWVTPQQLNELVDISAVNYIDVPKIVMPNNDIAVGSTGASLLQAGKLNNTMYKGDGVIVGVFDTGIDWDHLDFRNPADTTKSRILKLWDQTITPIIGEVSPSGFNYGVEYTQAQINNELDGSPAGYVREKDLNGHGTHVAGTAAGNGAALSTRKFAGVAPNADIVIVKGGNGSFSDYNEINAMTYFQNVANAFGKPIVVNMSIGGQFGAHDGSNPDEIAVDDFCNSAPGRVACISAGNDNGKAIHTQLSIAANGTGSVVVNVPTASGSSATDVFQISLYVNDTSSVNATITLPNGSTITANAGQSISPNVLSGAATAYFDNYIDADSKDRLINLYVVRSNTSANPSGAWTITFTNTTNKAIRIDGWLNYKGTNFGSTTVSGGDNNYLVGSPGNCTSAITVASYVGKLDWYSTSTTAAGGYQYSGSTQQDNISTFSSVGPRRDDVQKPTVAATGQAVVSCLASDAGISPSSNTIVVQGLYRAIQGTSMSSPVVTGCVALMLQTKPSATFTQIKNAITATATKDNFTGANTNYIFGAGKIDVFKAASSLITCTTFKRETISYDSSTTSAGNSSFSLSANKAATRFTATVTGKLGGVYFKTTTSIPTNSFTIEVRSSDGTNPAGLLGSLSVTPASIAKFSWNYYDITSLNIDVTTGTDYWVVLVPASNDSWGLGYESISNSGRSKYSNGSSWTNLTGDFRIRTVTYNNTIPSSSSTTNIKSCNNYTWNGVTYTTSGVYDKTGLVNAAGCDSTATLNLTINSSSSSTTNITSCNNYTWNGITYTTSGVYNKTGLVNAAGCDSTATLNLTINTSSSSTTNINACNSYIWNNTTYTASGTYSYSTNNSKGCDSVATLNLVIKQATSSTTNTSICSNQLPYSWNAQSFATAGSYVIHLTNAAGCDSAATLNLSVKNNYTITASPASNGSISPVGVTTICSGNNQTYSITPNSGYYVSNVVVDGISQGAVTTFIFSNVTANHTIAATFASTCAPNSSNTTANICSNQLPYSWNAQSYTSSGTYTIHLTNAAGCDSAATLVLNVTSTLIPTITIAASGSTTICSNASITLNATSVNTGSSPIYQWKKNGSNVSTGSSITFAPNTITTGDVITCGLTANNACQTSNTATSNAITVTVNAIPTVAAIKNSSSATITSATMCSLLGTLNLYNTSGGGVWSSDNTNVAIVSQNGVVTAVANGVANIKYTITSASGCSAFTQVTITVAALVPVNPIAGASNLCVGNATTYTTTSTGGVWSTLGRASITNAGIATGTSAGSTSIVYTITNAFGCSASASYSVTVNAIPATPTIAFAAGTTAVSGSGGYCKNKTFTLVGNPANGVWSKTGVIAMSPTGTPSTNTTVNTGNTTGAFSVSYTVANASGCTNTRTISANVVTCSSKGVNNQQAISNEQLVIYPNPAHSLVNLQVDKLVGRGSIVVTDLYGKTVKQQPLSMGTNTIDVSSFAKGLYMVSLITEQGKQTQKVVVE